MCKDANAGVPQDGEGWLSIVSDEDLGLMAVREDEFPASLAVVADALSGSVPMAVAVADAVQQYGHAVIRFPEGKGFADLMDRKSEGFEGWKHFAARGKHGGVDGGNAALRQAGLTASAVANMALQGAAIVVGQAYMARIDNELRGIREGIDGIAQRLDDAYVGKLEGHSETLAEYRDDFAVVSRDSMSRQAALNDIRRIAGDLRGSLNKEIKAL